jgi:hypothetical protein
MEASEQRKLTLSRAVLDVVVRGAEVERVVLRSHALEALTNNADVVQTIPGPSPIASTTINR